MTPYLLASAAGVLLMLQVGQTEQYAVTGAVTFEGRPVDAPVLVLLDSLSPHPVQRAFTSPSGRFTFNGVGAGTYYVRIQQEGFEDFSQRVDVPGFNRDLVIFLQQKSESPEENEDPALGGRFQVDVRQLSIPEKAVREYQKALEENQKGRTTRAIERFRHALSIAPNFVEAAFHLGSALYKTGRFEDAEKTFENALEIDPKDPHLRLMLANVFIKEHEYQKAVSAIDAYLEGDPSGPERESAETTRAQLLAVIQQQ